MTAEDHNASWAWLALIRRPQGRKGEVYAEILTDFPEKFAERRRLWLVAGDPPTKGVKTPAARPALPFEVELAAHWLHKGGIVLHFAGIDSISAAETLAGLAVAVPLEQRVPLAQDEAYIGDLISCLLFDVAGAEPRLVGEIEDVDRSAGPVALLVVKGEQGEVLIPFAKSYVRRIDIEGRRVEMALPEGLVDLNAPEKS